MNKKHYMKPQAVSTTYEPVYLLSGSLTGITPGASLIDTYEEENASQALSRGGGFNNSEFGFDDF